MAIETNYTQARTQLATFLDNVIDHQEVVIVNRRGKEPVAMIAAAELTSLMETAYLLRSPQNAKRLLAALQRAKSGKGLPLSLDQLRRKVGVGKA